MAAIVGGLLAFALLVPAVFLLQRLYEWGQRRIDAFELEEEGPADEWADVREDKAAAATTPDILEPFMLRPRELSELTRYKFQVGAVIFDPAAFHAGTLYKVYGGAGAERDPTHPPTTQPHKEELTRLAREVAELREKVAYLEVEKHYWEPGVAQRDLRPEALQEVHE